MDIFVKHHGQILSVDEQAELIEGNYESTRTVLLQFPDADVARGWITSPEYQEIAVARHEAATTDCVIVKGFSGPATS